MDFQFSIIPKNEIESVVPLVYDLNEAKISMEILRERFNEMIEQNYECAGIYLGNDLIGVSGLWYCTRHYAGKSVEIDHVFINPEYRGSGLGKKFMNWISNYVMNKGYQTMELNTYVQNYPSHKLYYNEGFEILGYHFLRRSNS